MKQKSNVKLETISYFKHFKNMTTKLRYHFFLNKRDLKNLSSGKKEKIKGKYYSRSKIHHGIIQNIII